MTGPVAGGARRWTNRLLVRERDARWLPWLWKWLLGLVLAVSPVGLWVLQQNRCIELSYRVDEMHREHDRLVEAEHRLQMERTSLESLDPIERWALRRHGMVRPPHRDVIVVDDSSRTVDVLPASEGRE